ncbi:MAG: hypothetical protein LBO75_04275 [Bifidobacteriaceae bacterium]|jgi:hypothetical protein|nr:hypothetical protein [Bifidobacteriaceae bacterium]
MTQQYLRGTSFSQCQIWKDGIGESKCNTGTGNANQVRAALNKAKLKYSFQSTMVSEAASKAEINGNRPMIVGYGYKAGGGHMVVVRSYVYNYSATDGRYLYWNDPADGKYKGGTYAYLKSNTQWTVNGVFYQLKKV